MSIKSLKAARFLLFPGMLTFDERLFAPIDCEMASFLYKASPRMLLSDELRGFPCIY